MDGAVNAPFVVYTVRGIDRGSGYMQGVYLKKQDARLAAKEAEYRSLGKDKMEIVEWTLDGVAYNPGYNLIEGIL